MDVNERIKKLILPEDDLDTVTDQEDKESKQDVVPSFHEPNKPMVSPHVHTVPPAATRSTGQTSQTSQTSRSSSGQTAKSSGQTSPQLSPKMDRAAAAATSGGAVESNSSATSGGGGSPGGGGGEPAKESRLEKEAPKFHLLSVLGVLIPHMKFSQQETRKETLRWIIWLHQQLPKRVRYVVLCVHTVCNSPSLSNEGWP